MTNQTKLKIERVKITKKDSSVYDEKFHSGLNVIRGENGTGKSTLIELISYGLGGDIKKDSWKEEALGCDQVFIVLLINKKAYTFKREIEGESNKPPISIYEGGYEESKLNLDKWTVYKYQKGKDRNSFAMQIFELLGYEQHITANGDSLTVHQLLRLLYVDQDTPASNIFRSESFTYDRESMRIAIGEFLFGFDNLEAHTIRQKLYEAQKRFDKLETDLKAIYRILGRTNIPASVKELEAEILSLHQQLTEVESVKSDKIEKSIPAGSEKLKNELREVRNELNLISKERSIIDEKIIAISYDIAESKEFIQTLDEREIALKQSQFTVNHIGLIEFEYCPSCLSKLSDQAEHSNCKLCRTCDDLQINESYIQSINELNFQRNETRRMIDLQLTEQVKLTASLKRINEENYRNKIKFNELNSFASDYEVEITKAAKEKGFIEAQIESYQDKIELAQDIEQQIDTKSELQKNITKLSDKLKLIETSSIRRKRKVFNSISEIVIDVLAKDIGVEDKAFANAKKFEFNFATDSMHLDGRAKFSASSNVLLKNAFHLAVLLTATNDSEFRIPCFTMFDNIEDKGMTEERSQNFQRILASKCSELKTDYQVIMSTSMVDESLNNKTYGVGPFYEKGEHTLDI